MDALGKMLEAMVIFVIIIFALGLWKQAAANQAYAMTQYQKQAGYTSLEMMGGQLIGNMVSGGF